MDALQTLIESETENVICSDGKMAFPTFFLKLMDYYKGMRAWGWKDKTLEMSINCSLKDLTALKICLDHCMYTPNKVLKMNNCEWLKIAEFLGLDLGMIKRIVDCLCGAEYTDFDFIEAYCLENGLCPRIKMYLIEKMYRHPRHLHLFVKTIFKSKLQKTIKACGNVEFLIPGYMGCYEPMFKDIKNYGEFLEENLENNIYNEVCTVKKYINELDWVIRVTTLKVFTRSTRGPSYESQLVEGRWCTITRFSIEDRFFVCIAGTKPKELKGLRFFNGVEEIFYISKHLANDSCEYKFDDKVTAILFTEVRHGDDY